MNLIEKFHAILVSGDINIWHYPMKQEGPKFYYWLSNEPENREGYGYYTLDKLIEVAYDRIDPLKKKLPEKCPEPTELLDIGPIS